MTDEEALVSSVEVTENFSQVFDAYYDRITRYLLKRIGNPDIAEDLSAITFTKAFEKRASFNANKGKVSTWLFAIATNELGMYLRKWYIRKDESLEAKQELGFEPQFADTHIDEKDNLTLVTQIKELAQQLPEGQREALFLHHFEGFNLAETAKILGKREGAIRTALSRGRKQLTEMCAAENLTQL